MDHRFETFSLSILELNRYLQKIKELEMKQFGLKASHTMCLYYLGQHPEGLTATQLTELCKEDKAAVSRCLSLLSDRQLVVCEQPADHKRSYRSRYMLTVQGRSVVSGIQTRIKEALSYGGRGLTEERRRDFYGTLAIISENLSDSASDLSASTREDLTILPLAIRFGDTEYLDGVTISHHEFYEKLIESDTLPTTSLVSPAAFEEVYARAVADGETVIAITISSRLSGTYQSATIAAEDFAGKVFVIDSYNATIGEGILVKYALLLKDQGLSAKEIVGILEASKEQIHTLGVLDTLEYLKKGGRISAATAFLGGAMAIKPVVAVSEGEIIMLGKARGSKNGNNFLMKEIEKADGIDFTRPFCLGYTGLSDEMLQKYIKDSEALWSGHTDQLPVCSLGATIGTHVGPGAIAVAFFSPQS